MRTECPEFEDREIPEDCYDCVYFEDGECIIDRVTEIERVECPYRGEIVLIPAGCQDCEYYDGERCFHPKADV